MKIDISSYPWALLGSNDLIIFTISSNEILRKPNLSSVLTVIFSGINKADYLRATKVLVESYHHLQMFLVFSNKVLELFFERRSWYITLDDVIAFDISPVSEFKIANWRLPDFFGLWNSQFFPSINFCWSLRSFKEGLYHNIGLFYLE